MAAVEIDRGQAGLEGAGQEPRLVAAPRALLAVAEAEGGTDGQLPRDLLEPCLADELRPPAGQLPLAGLWESLPQERGRDHPGQGVPEELQGLVVPGRLAGALVGEGAVGEGVAEDPRIPEIVTQGPRHLRHAFSLVRHGPGQVTPGRPGGGPIGADRRRIDPRRNFRAPRASQGGCGVFRG